MGWVEQLHGRTVALDAAPLIYFAEEHPIFLPKIEPFFVDFAAGAFPIISSTVTLLEVLVLPIRQGNLKLARAYRDILLHSQGLTLLPVSSAIAERAAQLRAQFRIKTPDALHVATALDAGAGFFVTNDDKLPTIPGIEIIALVNL